MLYTIQGGKRRASREMSYAQLSASNLLSVKGV